MTRFEAILSAILHLGQCWTDQHHEPYDDWQVRADTIAEAIDRVSRSNEEAAFLIYMAKHESGFSKAIHYGKITRHGKRYYSSLWQIDTFVLDSAWIVGTEQTPWAARLALDIYRKHRGTGTLIDGIRGYGGYKRWSPEPRLIARQIRKIEVKINTMMAQGREAA